MKKIKRWFISDTRFVDPTKEADEFFYQWSQVVGERDPVYLLGNLAVDNVAYWYDKVHKMPGLKVMFMGDHDKNRIKWYYKWGFKAVLPFNETATVDHPFGNVLVSHLPAFSAVAPNLNKYYGLMNRFSRDMDYTSSIMNIHGHMEGKGTEKHNTFDSSYAATNGIIFNMDQIIHLKYGV